MFAKLGSVRLFNEETGERELVPKPTLDPEDPLTWSTPYRSFLCVLAAYSVFVGNLLCAGPSVAMMTLATEFGNKGPDGTINLSSSLSKMSYAFTTYSLMQGTSNFFFVPLMTKYGRRPVFLVAYLGYLVSAIWASQAKSYGSFLGARIIGGWCSGVNETLGPLVITDVCFLHERATHMSIYNFCLSAGVSFGIIISGFIAYRETWRYIYYVGIAILGSFWLLIFFFLPETNFVRPSEDSHSQVDHSDIGLDEKTGHMEHHEYADSSSSNEIVAPKPNYLHYLKVWSGKTYTDESLWTIFLRPLGLIILPPVLWSSLVFTGTVGFIVAISSNYSTAYSETYGFNMWQLGLTWLGPLVGGICAVIVGGPLLEYTTNYFTHRNNGIREPEHRIPAVIIGTILCPVGLILYGVGIDQKMHWMVPTVGQAIMTFAIIQATTVSFVYCVDSYRPIAGEVEVTQLGVKALFGFLLSFYTNPWIDKEGYSLAFGEMSILAFVLIGCGIPLFWFGRRIRHASLKWRVVSFVHWENDRNVGGE